MKLLRTTEIMSIPHGIRTPHVTPCLQHSKKKFEHPILFI